MAYKVKEVIETERKGNKKQNETTFNTYVQAVCHIKQRMNEVIKQNTMKLFREANQKVTTEKLEKSCNNDLQSWLDEADNEQFSYVASYLG